MNGTKTRRQGFGISWWIGLGLFVALIGFMAFDILQREGGFGKSDDVLVMGTNAGFKPFEYKQGNEIVGFDVDLAKEIARSMNKELRIEDMSFDGLLPALESGQIDMAVAGMSVTPERTKNALFSEPYYSASQRIIVKKGSPIRNRYQLTGKKIGVQLGTTGDTLAGKIAGAKVSQFPTAPSVLTELNAGGVEAVILDDAPAAQYTAGFPDLEILPGELSSEHYAIAIKNNNHDLLEKINRVLAEMKKDGRYDNLIRKHFGAAALESMKKKELES
jgi:amino acid-binding protein